MNLGTGIMRMLAAAAVLAICTWSHVQAQEGPPPPERLEASGEWFAMKHSPAIEAGKPFDLEITLKDVEPELTLICALHWSMADGEYGDLLAIVGQQKGLENGKTYTFQMIPDSLPKVAATVTVVVHTSPTGNWNDLVNQGKSSRIPVARPTP